MRSAFLVLFAALAVAACERPGGCRGDYCGTLVIATSGEPDNLLPPEIGRASCRDRVWIRV